MKILYLITKSEAGGAQTHVYQLGKFFNSKNNEVVVTAQAGGWLEDECKKLGIKFVHNKYFSNKLNPFAVSKAIKQVKKMVKEFQPDIVHCHSSGAGFVGRLAVRNKIPTIFTAHGWGFNIGVPFLQKRIAIVAEKLTAKYCHRIICVSKFVKDLGLKYKIAKENKFEIIYNGIESKAEPTGYQHPPESRKLKVENKIKIIFVGRLAEPKQPLTLLKAVEGLPCGLKENIEVNIVGDGPKKNELEEFINQNKIENIKLLGDLPRDKVFDIMGASDVFVLVSKYEGLPMTILEAMNQGLSIITSDVGGVGEVIKDSINGFLLNGTQPDQLPLSLKYFCLLNLTYNYY